MNGPSAEGPVARPDIVAFLRARLDEIEAAARAATPGPWRHNPDKHWRKPGTSWFEEAVFAGPPGPDAICVAGTGESDDEQSMRDAEHIARHDPARVLREVEAKRRIMCEHEQRGVDFGGCWDCDTIKDPCRMHLFLAAIYSGHPDYDPAWRPS
ncbi:MAG TPA: DUF6221 family protein [Streptosporangiaceae bacterium]